MGGVGSVTHLLDTHTLLWMVGDPDRLGPAARGVVEDPQQALYVSAASTWEIATKRRLGRLPHADVLVTNYARHLRRLDLRPVPISDDHALVAGGLDWAHRDPFDRMLAAVAMVEGWILVTRDPAFGSLPGLRTLW